MNLSFTSAKKLTINLYEAVSSNITGTVTIENRVYHVANSSLDMVIKMDQTDEEEVSFVAQEKETVNVDDVTSDSETDSTDEIDAHALITTLYSDQ
ncbi:MULTISPECIES: hypothetical protein [Priestia]|uniref:hypothetical protein n=1 Tax=Priestia TaxID=2800373 RepID=UPI000BEF3F76|nr:MULTISPECIES: hypothetical protein [Priestia]MBY0214844.1 hypothetical protein [Priestia aryabhattai]MCM2978764.1 hypothetical protein [Priestia aryabhattai]NGY85511.1 hypothetical protein [Priestia megaterium]PEI54536.1 hypothetical protein CN635_20570 [Priestia aryabhattai]PHF64593.1 hypothetical protein COI42_26785 [Priestia aryabhattai]